MSGGFIPVDATGVHHVGISVGDLDASLHFYRTVFGLEPDYTADFSGEDLEELVEVSDARISLAMLTLGNTRIELLHYLNPVGRPFDRENSDAGVMHVAIEVSDIEQAFESLRGHGYQCTLEDPYRISEGPMSGCAAGYFRGPDNVVFELFEAPLGK